MTRLQALGFVSTVALALGAITAWVGAGGGGSTASAALPAQAVASAERRAVADIGFLDERGRPRRLSEFRGKVVLLNLWATWCPPCRKEMPSLDRLQSALGGADFEVVAVAADRGGIDAVAGFYREVGIRFLRAYADPGESAGSRLGTAAVPTTFLLDRDGKQIWRKIGPAEWDSRDAVERIGASIAEPASGGARQG
ncbi:MAG: hypothetical protein Fur0039_17790 [Rhodocyclaceae bacterium]